ncbi:MAG: hypothetical protein JL50_19560 [Peptococcaceae bacterium BICA1-7]|nr:MAG: hypothetical protein JL50_19560 [Peptococcaceae bacterium BICA1-7]HBV98273.1 spore coat protein [Desulfotomaculum sp.]
MHHQLGAHEVMEVHEVLTNTIDCINKLRVLRPHARDQRLGQIMDRQLNHAEQEYQNMVSLISHHRGVSVEPYHTSINTDVHYGLRNPSPFAPNETANQVHDRDIASILLGGAKATTSLRMRAALECADPQIRRMIIQSSVSSAEMAYETFCYMNERGMYQVPTMPMRTESNFIGAYQTNPGAIAGGFRNFNQLS